MINAIETLFVTIYFDYNASILYPYKGPLREYIGQSVGFSVGRYVGRPIDGSVSRSAFMIFRTITHERLHIFNDILDTGAA